MIIRIVKMVFKKEEVDAFKAFIETKAPFIRASEGCEYLQLNQDINHPEIIFTYSYWKDAAALDKYRHSELFEGVWTFTKSKFAKPAEAWSTHNFIEKEASLND